MNSSTRSTSKQIGVGWWLCALILYGCVAIMHTIAMYKMELQSMFAVMNSRTIHNMALIGFMDSHRGWVLSYLVFYLGVLTFSSLRQHPKWAILISFVFLGAPCMVYLNVCSHIAGKFLIFRW